MAKTVTSVFMDDEFKKIFRENWERAQSVRDQNYDSRSQFEALYNCFENIAQSTTGTHSGYMNRLKQNEEDNLIRDVSLRVYSEPNREGSFLFYLKQLRALQPIYNNITRERYFLTKTAPFNTFLDVLYTVRNNVRHGQKEFSERSEKILSLLNSLMFILITELYNTIFAEEIEQKNRQREEQEHRKFKNEMAWESTKSWFFGLVIIGIILLYLFGWVFTEPQDASQYENCSWRYTQDNIECY